MISGDPIKWAAWLYYEVGRTQNETAAELGVSRQTVANYLSQARALGYVSISLSNDILRAADLSHALEHAFALNSAHVVPDVSDATAARHRVAQAGAGVLAQNLPQTQTLGVASGRTLSFLAQAMAPAKRPDLTVVQVSGSSIYGPAHAAEICASHIASKLNAQCINLHAPAYLSSREFTQQLLAEPAVAEQVAMIANVDTLVFGVGELAPTTEINQPPFLNAAMRDRYRAHGAVAVVFGRFLDALGEEVDGPLRHRTVAIDLRATEEIPRRIAVCSGAIKAEAARAALRAGLVTDLVLDFALADALLRLWEEEKDDRGVHSRD